MNHKLEWTLVLDQGTADRFFEETRFLHDSVATAAHWAGAEFVNRRGELELHGFGSLSLEIVSQFKDVNSVEIRFNGVRSFQYDYDLELEARILFQPDGITARLLTWEVQAQSLEYRAFRPDKNDRAGSAPTPTTSAGG